MNLRGNLYMELYWSIPGPVNWLFCSLIVGYSVFGLPRHFSKAFIVEDAFRKTKHHKVANTLSPTTAVSRGLLV